MGGCRQNAPSIRRQEGDQPLDPCSSPLHHTNAPSRTNPSAPRHMGTNPTLPAETSPIKQWHYLRAISFDTFLSKGHPLAEQERCIGHTPMMGSLKPQIMSRLHSPGSWVGFIALPRGLQAQRKPSVATPGTPPNTSPHDTRDHRSKRSGMALSPICP